MGWQPLRVDCMGFVGRVEEAAANPQFVSGRFTWDNEGRHLVKDNHCDPKSLRRLGPNSRQKSLSHPFAAGCLKTFLPKSGKRPVTPQSDETLSNTIAETY
eukprot:2601241-Amphidinium_carterae.1